MSRKARNYKSKDLKKLFALSGNKCAAPECENQMVDIESETVLGEVCHISAASSNGPRFDPKMTDSERSGFGNLILLCGEHHKIIDNPNNLEIYDQEVLKEWKNKHEEQNASSPLKVSEKIINEIINNAFEQVAFTVISKINFFKKLIIQFFKSPGKFYPKKGIHYIDGIIFTTVSVVLVSLLEYPVFSSAAPLIREGHLWEIMLATPEEREFYLRRSFTLGSIEFFQILFEFWIWGFTFYILVRVLSKSYKKSKPFPFTLDVLVIFSIFNVGASIIFVVTFKSSFSEVISNTVFFYIFFFFIVIGLLLFFQLIRVLKNYLKKSFIKTFFLVILNSILSTLIASVMSLIIFEDLLHPQNSNSKASEQFNILAMEAFRKEKYDDVIEYSLEALKKLPENLFSEITIIYAKQAKVWGQVEDIMYSNNFDSIQRKIRIKKLIENYEDLKYTLADFADSYPRIPSTQLLAAQVYGELGLCDEVLKLAVSVYTNDYSNPSEIVEAASILNALTLESELNKDYQQFIQDTFWLKDEESLIGRIGLALRVSISRGNDNVNLFFNGHGFDETPDILSPKELSLFSFMNLIEVPYKCDQEHSFENEINEFKNDISTLYNKEILK